MNSYNHLYYNTNAEIKYNKEELTLNEEDDDNYAEIDVLATNDYYYITNLNQYYEQQQQQPPCKATNSSSPYKLNQSQSSQQHHHHQSCNRVVNKTPLYDTSSSSSSSWSDFTNKHNKYNLNNNNNSNIKYQSTNRITTTFSNIKCHHQYQPQHHHLKQHNCNNHHHVPHQSILAKPSTAINSFKGLSVAASSTSSTSVLRNTQKRCRRKLFAFNFMLKNFITYRFKYDIL
ncbi:hypothetical protein CVS40_7995 [Lucilia cuprina]|nr:hypothetical protein CVS40_7995 [Lucilia cuprina]